MESIESNIKEHQILTTLQGLKDKLKQENIDLKKLDLECSCINMLFINKDKSIGKKDFLRISSKSAFDPLEVKFYEKLKNIQSKMKYNPYDTLAKKISFYPKLGLNQKFNQLYGKSFDLAEAKEERLSNPSGISVISLIESENKTSYSAIQKTIRFIEKNKNLFYCSGKINSENNENNSINIYKANENSSNESIKPYDSTNNNNNKNLDCEVKFFSLTLKRNEFYFLEFKDLVSEKKWDKYGELYKHYFWEVHDSHELTPLDMFDFEAEEKEFFIVVDENGIIQHLGKFYDYSLEEKIKELIAKKGNNDYNKSQAHGKDIDKENKVNLVAESNKTFLNNNQNLIVNSNNNNNNNSNNINNNLKSLAEKNQNEKLTTSYNKDTQVINENKDLNSEANKENKNSENIKANENSNFSNNSSNISSIPKLSILPNFSEETEESPYNSNEHSLSHFTPYMNFKSNLSEIAQITNNNNNNNSTNNQITQKTQTSLNPLSSTLEINKTPGIYLSTNLNSNLIQSTNKNLINTTTIKKIDLTHPNTGNNILGKLKSFVSSALPINPIITNANFEAFQAEFQKAYKTPNSGLAVNYLFFCEMSKVFKYSVNLENLEVKKSEEDNPQFEIKIECLPGEVEIVSALMQKFFTREEVEKHNFSLKQIPNLSFKIASTTSCYLCQIVLSSSELQYFCFECRINFCSKCVQDFKNNFSGFAALVHKEHYLIAYQNPSKKNCENIAKYKLGNNLFAVFKEDQLRKEHNFGCDVCGNSFNHQERYICLTCRPGLLQSGGYTDICAKCFEKIHVHGQLSLLSNNTHKADHVYLHLVYSGVNYYDF